MVTVYSKPMCPACENTKRKLSRLGVEFEEKKLVDSPEILEEAKKRGMMAAPIVVANGIMWSGYQESQLQNLATEDEDWDF